MQQQKKRLCNHRDMQIECNDDIKALLLSSLSVRDAKTKQTTSDREKTICSLWIWVEWCVSMEIER